MIFFCVHHQGVVETDIGAGAFYPRAVVEQFLDFHQVNAPYDGLVVDAADFFDVGNDIVNTIINFYMQPIKNDYNIEVSGYMGSAIEIAERDLCTVCANLVKNAVEAVSMLDSGIIIFDVEQGNQYLSIMVENTYSGNIITDKEGKLVTQKEDKKNHGMGINNVKRIVKKYKGRYETEIDDKSYRVKVFLKIG